MRFLRLLFFCFILVIFLASCKSKKPVATNYPTKQKTDVQEKTVNGVVTKDGSLIKVSSEEIKIETKNIADKALANFIGDWYGTVYKYGGADKHGIDCSHFTAK